MVTAAKGVRKAGTRVEIERNLGRIFVYAGTVPYPSIYQSHLAMSR